MDAARELAQLLDRLLEAVGSARQYFLDLRPGARELPLGNAEVERERDEPLLRPVVEVALDPAARFVRRRDDASP